MSISNRRQRVRIYGYSDTGYEGEASSTYTFVAERWGQVTQTGGRETKGFGTTGHTVDAVVFLPDDVAVPRDGIVRHGEEVFFVRAIYPRLKRRELEVHCQRADDDRYVRGAYADGDFIADGSLTATGELSSLIEA